MAAPFDSENMMQRSLLGAIFGYKKNSNNSSSVSRSRASSIDQPNQPGPSWASAPTHHAVAHAAPLAPVPAATPAPAASVADASSDDYFPPPPHHHHQHHGFHGQHPPPLPVLTSQCPFSRQSYSSLAHQSHAPPGAYPPAPPHAPYAPYGGYAAPPPPYSPYAPPTHASHADDLRTQADYREIYREIVNECEEFERSSTTTPLVESSPATPTVHSPLASQWCGPQQPQQQQQQQPIHEITANFSMMDLPPGSGGNFPNLDHQTVASIMQQQQLQQFDVKPYLADAKSMEQFVRMIVQVVKEKSGELNTSNTPSPEEILKRKRQMNNEAAARYRKRQREEKEKQHGELDSLEQRNLELKRTVDDMEREIEVLKKYVLENRPIVVAKVEEEQI